MSNNFKFANINAKVKGMYAKFLSRNDYAELCKQETIEEMLVLLKNKLKEIPDIDDNATRREIEKMLYQILWRDVEKITRLLDKNDKEILNIYLERQKVKKELNLDETLENEFYKKYFFNLYKKIKEINNKSFLDIIGKQIDLLNILCIYRLNKYYNVKKDEVKNYQIPIYHKLTREILKKISLNQETIEDIMEETIYKQINFEAENLDREIQNYLYRQYINYFKTQVFNLTMVIAYLELRHIQIKNIITIVEGIRYKLDARSYTKEINTNVGGIINNGSGKNETA